jgi:hypothetical protein
MALPILKHVRLPQRVFPEAFMGLSDEERASIGLVDLLVGLAVLGRERPLVDVAPPGVWPESVLTYFLATLLGKTIL